MHAVQKVIFIHSRPALEQALRRSLLLAPAESPLLVINPDVLGQRPSGP